MKWMGSNPTDPCIVDHDGGIAMLATDDLGHGLDGRKVCHVQLIVMYSRDFDNPLAFIVTHYARRTAQDNAELTHAFPTLQEWD